MRICLFVLFVLFGYSTFSKGKVYSTGKFIFKIEVIAEKLNHPWGIAFLSNNDFLITERNGGLVRVKNGKKITIEGLNINILQQGQGGLLDIATHPNFNQNGWIYMVYSKKLSPRRSTTAVVRFKLNNNRISQLEQIFESNLYGSRALHYGSKIAFDDKGHIFFSVGDRYAYPSAGDITHPESTSIQKTTFNNGKIIRLHVDGRIPKTNPFNQNGKPNAVFSLGHRNPQGLVFDKKRQWLIAHEHGAQGGDEINIIKAAKNYGWPVISYGEDYSGKKIGYGTKKTGYEEPAFYWDPSIAPSGFCVYYGNRYPGWYGKYFVGSLKFGLMIEMSFNNNAFKEVKRYFNNDVGRIRDIKVSPDGYLYLLTDQSNGKLLKIIPVR